MDGILHHPAGGEAAEAAPARGDRRLLRPALGLVVLLVLSNAWQLFVLGPDGDPAASSLARAIYLPAYGAALWLIALEPRRALDLAARSPALLALLLLALLSALWAPDPGLTLRRGAALLLTTLAGLGLVAAFGVRRLTALLALAFLGLGAASLLTGLLRPDLGRMTTLFPGAWRGVWLEKNALGDHMALGAVIAVAALSLDPGRRILWSLTLLLALALVVLSTSKTSLVALAAGLGAAGLLAIARRGPLGAIAVLWGAVVLLIGGGAALWLLREPLLGLLGRDATLTGRTALWEAILRLCDQRPLLGWGYGSVWRAPTPGGPWAWITRYAGFEAYEAHDSWLSVRLDLGLLGLGLFGLYTLETGWRALGAALRAPAARLALPALAFLFVEQVTETCALDFNNFVWTIFAAMGFLLAARGDPPAPSASSREPPAPRASSP